MNVAALPAIRSAVADVLDQVRQRCQDAAAQPWARTIYASTSGVVDVRLSLLSPLAEGSDRLVASEALARSYRLTVPMPFAQDEYERDFHTSIDAFHALLAHAEGRVLALDGGRGDDEWRSYEAVGRLVVRNCDLLIAVWDDAVPPKGLGGTKDTLHFALQVGVPVWWIDAAGRRPSALVTTLAELRHTRDSDPKSKLADLIESHLKPPPAKQERPAGILHRLLAALSRTRMLVGLPEPAHIDPLQAFLAETEPRPSRLWKAHRSFIKAMARGFVPRSSVDGQVEGYWGRAYTPPDRLSNAYGQRYRSTYVYVIALATLALLCPVLVSVFEALHWHAGVTAMVLGELFSLVLLLGLIGIAQARRWHERWIGYRLLAELFRKQGAMALLGWSLPVLKAGQSARPGAHWLAWYFEAATRAAPLATGTLAGADLGRIRDAVSDTLVAGQIDYHVNRKAESELAAKRLFRIGETCFFVTLVFVLGKLLTLYLAGVPHGAVLFINVATSVLPSVSAAVFAVRAYAELEVLADQSEQMVGLLEALEARLDLFNPNVPLASQELGRDLYHLAIAMLADVAGWAQLFRMKAVEAG